MDQPPDARTVRRITAWWNDDFQHEFDWDIFSTGTWPEGQNVGAPQAPPPGSGDGRSSGSGDASGKSAGYGGGKPRGRNSWGKTKKTEGQDSTGTWDPDPWAHARTGASQDGGGTQVDVASQHGGATHVDGAAQDGGGTQVAGASQHGGGTDDKGVDGESQPHPQFGFPLPRHPPPPPPDQPCYPWPFRKWWG